jgi:molybdopterin-guanine dinucleotide biosynthesis protein A
MTTESDLYGLILMGGSSTRMGHDKASIEYHHKPQAQHIFELLSSILPNTFVSVRQGQKCRFTDQIIEDALDTKGPINGILSAMQRHPDMAWLVLACDLPLVSERTIQQLIQARDTNKIATAFAGESQLPEPLTAIWERAAYTHLRRHHLEEGKNCPRKFLINSDIHLISPADQRELFNANSPDEYQIAKQWIGK